jgi:uncharacterized protein HemX
VAQRTVYQNDARGQRPGRRGGVAAALLAGLALLILAGAVSYFAHASHDNRAVAARWQARATQLVHLLNARTAQLSERDAALNRTTKELTSLNSQVAGLESRQRNLVSEKAQVEDQRGLLVSQAESLAKLAGREHACNAGLTTLFNKYAAHQFAWVDAHADAVQTSCQQAQAAFDAFESQYAGG